MILFLLSFLDRFLVLYAQFYFLKVLGFVDLFVFVLPAYIIVDVVGSHRPLFHNRRYILVFELEFLLGLLAEDESVARPILSFVLTIIFVIATINYGLHHGAPSFRSRGLIFGHDLNA